MNTIRYPGAEVVEEITARYLLSMPTGLMPMLYGFRFDGEVVDGDCAAIDLSGDRGAGELNPIHVRAARLREILGPEMFGFGLVFVVCADQLTDCAANRHIPERVRAAARQLPGSGDVIAAVVVDATGRQWWAVVDRYLLELDPVRIHVPARDPGDWSLPESLDASLLTAALALDPANHSHLLRLRTPHRPEG